MGSSTITTNMDKLLIVALMVVFALALASAMPYNAVGPFYNGDMKSSHLSTFRNICGPDSLSRNFLLVDKSEYLTDLEKNLLLFEENNLFQNFPQFVLNK